MSASTTLQKTFFKPFAFFPGCIREGIGQLIFVVIRYETRRSDVQGLVTLPGTSIDLCLSDQHRDAIAFAELRITLPVVITH